MRQVHRRQSLIRPCRRLRGFLSLQPGLTRPISYLPLRHFRAIPKFFRYTAQTQRQLKATPGIIGYALQARPFTRQFWTLSVWADQQSLENFVRQIPHSQIMQALAPHMGETSFAQWTVTSTEIPLIGPPRSPV